RPGAVKRPPGAKALRRPFEPAPNPSFLFPETLPAAVTLTAGHRRDGPPAAGPEAPGSPGKGPRLPAGAPRPRRFDLDSKPGRNGRPLRERAGGAPPTP